MKACILSFMTLISIFFFFQAEDGIRDPLVTGVQTCALPISTSATGFMEMAVPHAVPDRHLHETGRRGGTDEHRPGSPEQPGERRFDARERSEERRVGKESR